MPLRATTPKPPPVQKRAAAKRAAILDAAERLLADQSPASLSTRGVAERANIPVGSVYRYFANRDDLLSALFERMNAGTVDWLETALSDVETRPWQERVALAFDHLGHMHASHPSYGALQAYLDDGPQDSAIAALLDALIRRDAPHLGPDLGEEVARTIMAMIDGIERRLYRLPASLRAAALDQARLAVTAYLAHHIENDR